MKNNRIFIFSLCIFVLMLAISSVSASDINTNETTIETPIDEPVISTDVSAGDYASLKSAISSSNQITLTGDITRSESDTDIDIYQNQNITINGNGHIISANKLGRIFQILPGGELTLNNVQLINGYLPQTLTGNFDGGAILNMGTLTIKDCQFINNFARDGGAIACDLSAKTTISGTNVFSDNKAWMDGGAIANQFGSTLSITGKNTFRANTASEPDGRGGAILNSFRYKEAPNNMAYLYINGETTFADNQANIDGGAIFNHQAMSNITGVNTFTNNQANGGDGKGGAINNENGTVFLSGTNTFTNNFANRGGAIDNNLFESEFTLSGKNTFTNNKVTFQGGAIANQEATRFTMSGTNTFTSNSADAAGGAFSSYLTPVYISGDNTFSKNTAVLSGGAMNLGNAQTISITGHSYFYDNKATGSGASGGGIYAAEGSTLNLRGAVFLRNSAVYGGAVFVNNNPINAFYNIFSDNTASMSGSDVEVFQSAVNSLNMNYWASQAKPEQSRIHNYDVSNIASWVILNSVVPSEITQGESTQLVKFVQNSGSDVVGEMGNFTVTVTPNFDPSSVVITKNVGSSTYKGDTGSVGVTVTGSGYTNTKTVNVVSGILKTTIEGNDVLLFVGESGSYIATLKDVNNKVLSGQNIVLTFNGRTYTEKTDSKGQVSLAVSNLTAGSYKIEASFAATSDYENSSATNYAVVFTTGENNTKISANNISMYYKDGTRYVATVTANDGTPLANVIVKIMLNGRTYSRTTNSSGQVSMALNLDSNTYNVTSYFVGSGSNRPVFIDNTILIKATISGDDVVKYYKNATQYYAKFLNAKGNALANTKITFNINGVMYERTTNGSGVARLNINLEEGSYILTAINPVNNEMFSNTIKVLSVITDNKDVTKYYRNATQYVLQILGGDGKPVGKGVNVTFNINGVFYTRSTNETGHAKLNLNLQPNDYVITADYNGCKVANKIKVLPVLSARDLTMSYRDGSRFVANLIDGSGKALANTTVSFNVNGVFYERLTNGTGQASLNINLMAGQYIITSSYNGANVANTITING